MVNLYIIQIYKRTIVKYCLTKYDYIYNIHFYFDPYKSRPKNIILPLKNTSLPKMYIYIYIITDNIELYNIIVYRHMFIN